MVNLQNKYLIPQSKNNYIQNQLQNEENLEYKDEIES